MGTAGYGAGDHNSVACSSNYTYVDTEYPATETFMVDTIYVYNTDAGTNWKIGCGTIAGSTFTPRSYVTIASVSTGANTFTSPTDFTSFEIQSGDFIYFYSNTAACEPDTTSSAIPEGLAYISGDHMDDASFVFGGTDSNRTIEVQFSGDPASDWSAGTWNGIASLASWNGLLVASLASWNGL